MTELLRELAVDLFATVVGVTIVGLPVLFMNGIG